MSADGARNQQSEGTTTAPLWSLAVSIAIPELNFVQICAASEWLDPASRRAFLLETAAALTGVEIAEGVVARIAGQTFLA